MMAPDLISLRQAYAPARRSFPRRLGAKNRSLIAWDGCMDGNDTEFREAWNVSRVENLRMLNPPPRLAHLSLLGRHRFERLFVEIENRPVRTIPDRVGFDLDSAPQGFLEQRPQFGFLRCKKPRSVRGVAIRFQQGRAARAEGAVENDLDGALREPKIVAVQRWSFFQEPLRIGARAINGVVDSDLELALRVKPPHQIGIGLLAAGILDLAPAQFDLAFDP